MKAIVVLMSSMVLFLFSCTKDSTPNYVNFYNDFSFEKKKLEFKLSEFTDNIVLNGNIGLKKEDIYLSLAVDDSKTTALVNEHYVLPEQFKFFFPKGDTKSKVIIKIVRENIKEPIDISFTTKYKLENRDYSKYIDTIVVRLIP